MVDGEQLLAIVPARGGSKGIPGKNLRRLGRHTLLERAALLGLNCPAIDRVVVSTNDPEMHELAGRLNVAMPTLRPAHLADDQARTLDVVLHAVEQLDWRGRYLLLLQPTAPFRSRADLDNLLQQFFAQRDRYDAAVSLCLLDEPHPRKLQTIRDGRVAPYLAGDDSGTPRQQLPAAYRLNGAFYLIDIAILREQRSFLPPRTLPLVMPAERSINLDSMFDWWLAETLVERRLVPFEEYDHA